ncbi:MAG: hypothetical protein FVQ84_04720 [Planctomycetes bacterium]|nr:hypothetical protein [Planctomycetota bacterium]
MKYKQIIIDKDAFVGIKFDKLCNFAKNHLLILPDVLCYECHTDFNIKTQRTLKHCQQLIQNGAYYCSCSTGFLQSEGSSLESYPWFLPDLEVTCRIKNGTSENVVPDAMQMFKARYGVACRLFVDAINRVCKRVPSELQDSLKKIQPQGIKDRFEKFLNNIDANKDQMRDFALRSMPDGWVKNISRFCLSEKWISWHYFRLVRIIAMEYSCRGLSSGAPSKKQAEHDYQDMEYVLLLSRADGLLTRDKKLVKPLAKAAFPEKDVFENLEDVPDEYLCNWS